MQVGDKIKHVSRDELGIGKVESISESGVTVLFGNARFTKISPNSIRLSDKSDFSKNEILPLKSKTTSTNESSFASRFSLCLIPAFIVILILNQSAYGSCYSGYCLSAAFPRVLIISIIISFIAAANSG